MKEALAILQNQLIWEQELLDSINKDLNYYKTKLDKTRSDLEEKVLKIENLTLQIAVISKLQS